MRVSVAQLAVQLGDPQANFERVRTSVEEASRSGSSLIVFPELWSTGYDLARWNSHADALGEGMFARVAALARQHRICIAGSLLERRGRSAYNTFVLHGREGESLGVYRKVHLVPMLDEPKWLAAGDALTVAECSWGKTGLGICYDLRFPEPWRRYALAGARLMIVPAEWPAGRVGHWQVLLRSRAIENQAFVVGCNRVGESQGQLFGGMSAVIDPWGTALAEADDRTETLLTVDIDLAQADRLRGEIPVLRDVRPDVYGAATTDGVATTLV